MLRTVVVPLDGSELAEGILPILEPFLADPEATVELLRVASEGTPTETEQQAAEAQHYLAGVAERLAENHANIGTHVAIGDPAEQILARAKESCADLIAIGTHGRGGLVRFVRGSVAERVLRYSTVPLLLANPKALGEEPRIRRILLPLDGSDLADRALPFADVVANTCGAEVLLLRVEPFVPVTVPSPVMRSELWQPDQLLASLEPRRERLERSGVKVEARATIGTESVEILGAANEVDLVVMATHGRSGFSRWWFGSVAEQVLRGCSKPLLLIPTRAPAGEGS